MIKFVGVWWGKLRHVERKGRVRCGAWEEQAWKERARY